MAEKKFIDLGENYGECCAPIDRGKKYYPSFSLESDAPAGLKVGDEGTATIKFKVCSRNESESDDSEGIKKSMRLDILAVAFDQRSSNDKKSTRDDQNAIKKGLDDEIDE